jgi:hypothetical protein
MYEYRRENIHPEERRGEELKMTRPGQERE